jgi:hypothetical protein
MNTRYFFTFNKKLFGEHKKFSRLKPILKLSVNFVTSLRGARQTAEIIPIEPD